MNPTAEIEISKGTPGDARELSEVAAGLFRQTYEGKLPARDLDEYITEDFNRERQFAELGDAEVGTLLVRNSGELVGYAQVRRKPIPVDNDPAVAIELWRIYLDRACHGQGIGKKLLSQVGETALAMSGDHLLWLGVWERNRRAISSRSVG